MIDPKLLYEDKNCKGCSEQFSSIAFNYCMKCTENSLVKVSTKFKDRMKWRKRKKFAYTALITFPLLSFIGIYFGLTIEWICIGCIVLGSVMNEICNFLVSIF